MKKTLLSEAKAELIDMMKLNGEISVDDAVDELDLAKTTIRQHLQLLEQYGLVQRRQQRQGRGRPRIMYSLTDEAREFYPSQEPRLLRKLVEYLLEQGHLMLVDDFFHRHWQDRADEVMERADELGGGQEATFEALHNFLSDEGFFPETTTNGTNELRVCNCPYRTAVSATRLPCRLEMEFLEQVTGKRVERTEYMFDGDNCCAYRFGQPTSEKA